MSLLLLAALRATATNPAPEPVDTSSLTLDRQFTTNTSWQRTYNTADDRGLHVVTKHDVRRTAKAPRVRYNIGTGIYVEARVGLIVDGAIHWLTWGGEPRLKISQRKPVAIDSDPLPDTVVARSGTTIYSVFEYEPGSGYAVGSFSRPHTIAIREPGTFQSFTAFRSAILSGAPLGILGKVDPADGVMSVAHTGDSFSTPGWARNAYDNTGLAWSDLAQGAEGTPYSPGSPGVDDRIGSGDLSYDFVFSAYGGNSRGAPPETQVAWDIAWWTDMVSRGAKVAAYTLHPYATLSEEHNLWRIQRNEWMRDGFPMRDGIGLVNDIGATGSDVIRYGDPGHPISFPVFDMADICETERNSGIWKPGLSLDGTHLSPGGSGYVQPHFEQWVADNLT